VDVALELLEGVDDDGLIALVRGGEQEGLGDLRVLGLGDARPCVRDLVDVRAVIVDELPVARMASANFSCSKSASAMRSSARRANFE